MFLFGMNIAALLGEAASKLNQSASGLSFASQRNRFYWPRRIISRYMRAMDSTVFITLAYAITGLLLALLCLATWLHARTTNRELAARRAPQPDEAPHHNA
jgi:hypothetical protein